MKDKLLIVGGTGFIGCNLAKKSKELDYEVTCISSKYPSKKKRLDNDPQLLEIFLNTGKIPGVGTAKEVQEKEFYLTVKY